MRKVFLIILLLVPGLARAQLRGEADGWVPPPLVEAPDASPQPAPDRPGRPAWSTPPPRAALEPPGPEVGLMATQLLFGALSAAGSSLLMYYLMIKPFSQSIGTQDPMLGNLIFLLGFSSVPLTVSRTQVGLANGSAYYVSESWPAALSALAAQAAVIGLYYYARPYTSDGGEAVLLGGTVGLVPLASMVAINLTKQPRWKVPGGGIRMGSGVSHLPGQGWSLGIPLPHPIPGPEGRGLGLSWPALSGAF
jgi:hypothetical protein